VALQGGDTKTKKTLANQPLKTKCQGATSSFVVAPSSVSAVASLSWMTDPWQLTQLPFVTGNCRLVCDIGQLTVNGGVRAKRSIAGRSFGRLLCLQHQSIDRDLPGRGSDSH